MDKKEIERFFSGILENEPNVSAGMAAIRTLFHVLEKDQSETVQELDSNFQTAVDIMKSTDYPVTAISSGCELFKRFITLARLDTTTIKECKMIMVNRGKLFVKKLMGARAKIANIACSFFVDGCRILTHSKSRVVLEAMKLAAMSNKRFEVYVTMSSPDNSGKAMCRELEDANIPCTLIVDSAIGYVMEQIDMVMVGAEGIMESGGIVNKIGSYTIAICAKEMKKPFYVLTESFKFARVYPLSQRDLPAEFKFTTSTRKRDINKEHPLVDYTPPAYITLLFTDLGVLTPSAVSDELIKLKAMCRELEDANIPCTLIVDSAIGYVMEQIDMVMVGAEGIMESGGIVNKIGSYTMAICAKEMKKPFYVLTESFKFARVYPLSQRDLPAEFKFTTSTRKRDINKEHPLVDYTPPAYITLLFTDLGVLTPSAVSDELIKLYL